MATPFPAMFMWFLEPSLSMFVTPIVSAEKSPKINPLAGKSSQ
jgi:hypothetical protein